VTEFSSGDKDVLICALVNKLGGVVSLRPFELQISNIHTRLTQLPTGTMHLELVATPPPTSDEPTAPSTADSDALMHLGG
jgi:hypothetical protein